MDVLWVGKMAEMLARYLVGHSGIQKVDWMENW